MLYVNGVRGLDGEMGLSKDAAEGIQLAGFLCGCLEAHPVHCIHSLFIEAEHVVTGEVRVDGDVEERKVILPCVVGEKVHRLHEDIPKILDLLGRWAGAGKVYADDDIGPHPLHKVGGIVVAHSAVHKDHPFRAHRHKEAGDGHG